MTLPMSLESKDMVFEKTKRSFKLLENMARTAVLHMGMANQQGADTDYHLVCAKNLALEINNASLEIDHNLHEVIDAPVI